MHNSRLSNTFDRNDDANDDYFYNSHLQKYSHENPFTSPTYMKYWNKRSKNQKIALNFQTTVAILSFGPINKWIYLYIYIMDGFQLSNVIYCNKSTESH